MKISTKFPYIEDAEWGAWLLAWGLLCRGAYEREIAGMAMASWGTPGGRFLLAAFICMNLVLTVRFVVKAVARRCEWFGVLTEWILHFVSLWTWQMAVPALLYGISAFCFDQSSYISYWRDSLKVLAGFWALIVTMIVAIGFLLSLPRLLGYFGSLMRYALARKPQATN